MLDNNLNAEQIARELDFIALIEKVKEKIPEQYREGFVNFWTEKYEQKLAVEIKNVKDFERILKGALIVFGMIVGVGIVLYAVKDL